MSSNCGLPRVLHGSIIYRTNTRHDMALVDNYGVPSKDTGDPLLEIVLAHFEAAKLHITSLVVTSYAKEDCSHYFPSSSGE